MSGILTAVLVTDSDTVEQSAHPNTYRPAHSRYTLYIENPLHAWMKRNVHKFVFCGVGSRLVLGHILEYILAVSASKRTRPFPLFSLRASRPNSVSVERLAVDSADWVWGPGWPMKHQANSEPRGGGKAKRQERKIQCKNAKGKSADETKSREEGGIQ